jgi:hypothetical protein
VKVIATDSEIHSYKIDTEIHREGEVYFATIYYDPHDGYEVMFRDPKGQSIATPEWVIEAQERDDSHSVGYWLEDQIQGRYQWINKEEANA